MIGLDTSGTLAVMTDSLYLEMIVELIEQVGMTITTEIPTMEIHTTDMTGTTTEDPEEGSMLEGGGLLRIVMTEGREREKGRESPLNWGREHSVLSTAREMQ